MKAREIEQSWSEALAIGVGSVWQRHEERIVFLAVGAWNTAFGYALFAGLYYFLRGSLHVTVVIAISYAISTASNYVCYKTIVFKTHGNVLREYAKFTLVYAPALVANLIVLPLALRTLPLNAYVVQAVFTLVVMMASYVGHKYFTFRSSGPRVSE